MLSNKKVYVGKHSKEIQEKAFALGIKWNDGTTDVSNLDYPFLFFHEYNRMTCDNNLVYFNNCNSNYEEITTEEILAMEVPKPKKSCKELGEVNGYYISEDEILNFREWNPNFDISDFDDGRHFDILPTKEEAEAYKILPFLLQWRDRYNEGWKPDWKSNIVKYVIYFDCDKIYADTTYYETYLFSFECEEIRDKFLEDFKEELEIVKPLL